MQDFLDTKFLSNTIWNYITFLLSFAGSVLLIFIFNRIVLKRLLKRAKQTQAGMDDILIGSIRRYLMPLLYFGAFYLSTKLLIMDPLVAKIVNIITLGFIMVFGAIFASSFFIFLFNWYWNKKMKKTDHVPVRWISAIVKIVVWIGALLLFFENIGVEVTALIAGLGIGGIAIAFAAQAILEDIFSFVTIFFDRPFEIDDFITVGDMMGTVEHIGIKTTRLRSLNGEQLVFSNKDLTSSRLKNYKSMKNRRVLFSIGVTYDTPTEKLKQIPDLMKTIISGIEGVAFDRAHFAAYAQFSLNFEIVYYVLSQDYNQYMDIQQEINLRIKEEFDKKGISFAYPTQNLYIKSPLPEAVITGDSMQQHF